ncbi:hypothetical protein G6F37_009829 [Rhizopus arrhizus]|nr:hypothetical protein G6F38_009628 [Rhizopus arrhizus]KAG1154020.1 hypothetical protein G6F37_009829 [Rhizopus arrhizus]
MHQRPAITRESLLHLHSSATSRPSSDTVDLHTTALNTAQPVSDFMKARFIANNEILMNIAIEQASIRNSDEIGCDQEKVYDTIHPNHLHAVLVQYGFLEDFVPAIDKLFFGNLTLQRKYN